MIGVGPLARESEWRVFRDFDDEVDGLISLGQVTFDEIGEQKAFLKKPGAGLRKPFLRNEANFRRGMRPDCASKPRRGEEKAFFAKRDACYGA